MSRFNWTRLHTEERDTREKRLPGTAASLEVNKSSRPMEEEGKAPKEGTVEQDSSA